MEDEIKILEEEFQKDYQEANTHSQIESLRIKYLGRKSRLNYLFSRLPTLSKEEKKREGRQLNFLKEKINSLIDKRIQNGAGQEQKIDLTFPSAS